MTLVFENLVSAVDSFKANLYNPPDFEITSGEFTWKVHEHVLAKDSDFFKTIFSNGFLESETRAVTLEDKPLNVAQMIMWMYKRGYTVHRNQELADWPRVSLEDLLIFAAPNENDGLVAVMDIFSRPDGAADWEWEVNTHSDMYVMADKYGIEELKRYSFDRMFQCVASASKEAIWLILGFVESTALNTTALKVSLASCFAEEIVYYMHKERFKVMMRKHGDIAVRIVWALAAQL